MPTKDKEKLKAISARKYQKIKSDPEKWRRYLDGIKERHRKHPEWAIKIAQNNKLKRKFKDCIKCGKPLSHRRKKYCGITCVYQFELKTRFEVLKRDNFTCQYCGRKAPDVALHVDHIHPKSKGGQYVISNLNTSCFDCNLGKGDKILSQ